MASTIVGIGTSTVTILGILDTILLGTITAILLGEVTILLGMDMARIGMILIGMVGITTILRMVEAVIITVLDIPMDLERHYVAIAAHKSPLLL